MNHTTKKTIMILQRGVSMHALCYVFILALTGCSHSTPLSMNKKNPIVSNGTNSHSIAPLKQKKAASEQRSSSSLVKAMVMAALLAQITMDTDAVVPSIDDTQQQLMEIFKISCYNDGKDAVECGNICTLELKDVLQTMQSMHITPKKLEPNQAIDFLPGIYSLRDNGKGLRWITDPNSYYFAWLANEKYTGPRELLREIHKKAAGDTAEEIKLLREGAALMLCKPTEFEERCNDKAQGPRTVLAFVRAAKVFLDRSNQLEANSGFGSKILRFLGLGASKASEVRDKRAVVQETKQQPARVKQQRVQRHVCQHTRKQQKYGFAMQKFRN